MTEIMAIRGMVLISIDDIKEARCLELHGAPEEDLSGKYIVRIFSRTPFVNIAVDNLEDAKTLCKNILKSKHVVDINQIRQNK